MTNPNFKRGFYMKNRIPRVCAANDLSGFGRCSLTTAIPILSVMGVQCCPLPTAILSCQTGFSSFHFRDLTEDITPYINNWSEHGIDFDTIYTGFLGSSEQIYLMKKLIEQFGTDSLIFIDPVMGDDGKLYSTYTQGMLDGMKKLIKRADIITPNVTEACMLLNREFTGNTIPIEEALEMAKMLCDNGAGITVITGVNNGGIATVAYDKNTGESISYSTQRTKMQYSGTGDIFASVLCGSLTKGNPLKSSIEIASEFVRETTDFTMRLGTPLLDGIAFEPFLAKLGGASI